MNQQHGKRPVIIPNIISHSSSQVAQNQISSQPSNIGQQYPLIQPVNIAGQQTSSQYQQIPQTQIKQFTLPSTAIQKPSEQSYANEFFAYYFKNLTDSGINTELAEKFPEIKSFYKLLQSNHTLRRIFSLCIENIQAQTFRNAIFFADKLLTLTDAHLLIVYLLGLCYFHNQDYKKVHSLFVKYKLLAYNNNFLILAAQSLLKNKQFEICQNILEIPIEVLYFIFQLITIIFSQKNSYTNQKLEGIKYLLKAQCLEANENKQFAIICFKECLKRDPTCIEAFTRLIDCYLLSNQDKENLLLSMNFSTEDQWIKKFYQSLIKESFPEDQKLSNKISLDLNEFSVDQSKSNHAPKKKSIKLYQDDDQKQSPEMQIENNQKLDLVQIKPDNVFEILNSKNNIDILYIKAKNANAKYDIMKAYEISVQAIKEDPLYFNIIPIYCTCLLELNYLGELYYCAHNLIENYSQHPLSWFAIGVYYFLAKKYEVARKYFQKAHMIDRNFIFTWIGFGHSFAIQDESDQAMTVYRTTSRLFPGCFAAHLYMGMEYLRTNNLKTAQLSFQCAREINGNDPLICNEIGVIYFKQKQFEEAKQNFESALQLCDKAISWVKETIYSNLAHTCRKLKEYKNAIKYYEKCISINSKNALTYFSLAYTCHISNQLNKAISYYHKSIHYKYDNQFAHDMLSRCLNDAADLPWNKVYNI